MVGAIDVHWYLTFVQVSVVACARLSRGRFYKGEYMFLKSAEDSMLKQRRKQMNRTAVLLLATIALVVVTFHSGFAQQCPVGSYLWVDNWGNRICKRFDTGETTTVEGNIENCFPGTYPWVDEWGSRICKGFKSGQQYYDTSKGCPIGTYQWIDNWGNPVCVRF